MFKGKITIVKNINGKEEKLEKEFNSEKEYREFLRENNMNLPEPRLTLSEWSSLGDYIDNIFEERLNNFFLPDFDETEYEKSADLPVDISKYEKEAQKIEKEKEEKTKKKDEIKRAIKKLKDYVKTFEKEDKKDLAQSAKEDIKKLEQELESLQ